MKYSMRKRSPREYAVDEFYHVYNRGVEKINISKDESDSNRFIQSICVFNQEDPVGSLFRSRLYENKVSCSAPSATSPLVTIIAYCLNPNHYHLLVQPLVEGGLSLFMQKLGSGYTMYFNKKYERTGVLFQGKFKARHITQDGDLQRMSAYINLNDKVHKLSAPSAQLVRSSMNEYMTTHKGMCDTSLILDSFRTQSAYKKFAQRTVKDIAKERAISDGSYKKELYARYFD